MSASETKQNNIDELADLIDKQTTDSVEGQSGTVNVGDSSVFFGKALQQQDPSFTIDTANKVDDARTVTIAAVATVIKRRAPGLFKANADVKNISTGKIALGEAVTTSMNVERSHIYPAVEAKGDRPGRDAVEKFGVLSVDHVFQGSRASIGSLGKIRTGLNDAVKEALNGA